MFFYMLPRRKIDMGYRVRLVKSWHMHNSISLFLGKQCMEHLMWVRIICCRGIELKCRGLVAKISSSRVPSHICAIAQVLDMQCHSRILCPHPAALPLHSANFAQVYRRSGGRTEWNHRLVNSSSSPTLCSQLFCLQLSTLLLMTGGRGG